MFALHAVTIAQFSFVQITDLHIADGKYNLYHHDNNGVMFQKVLNAVNGTIPKPAFVVATGDISNIGEGGISTGSEGMYEALTKHLFANRSLYPAPGDLFIDSARHVPIYFTPGNHDYYTRFIPYVTTGTLAYYAKHISPDTDYCVVYKNAVILFVRSGHDAHRSLKEDKDWKKPECSGLSNSQCSWIRNTLKTYSDKRKIIVMHHPAVDVNGIKVDGTVNTIVCDTADGSLCRNRTMFLNICDSNHVDVVLNGHSHQNVVCNRAGKVVDNNWALGTRYVQTAPGFLGCYRIITVDSGFVYVGIPQITSSIDDKNISSPGVLKYDETFANTENFISFGELKIQ